MVRHDPLLRHAAVVLQREDERVFGSLAGEGEESADGVTKDGEVHASGRRKRTWKACSLMAPMTSLKRICEVRV